jgi:hypothetical protein
MNALPVAAGLCAVAAIVGFAPFLLPWPLRLRWMIVTAMADPWTARASPPTLEECRIEALEETDGGLLLICGPDGSGPGPLHIPLATSAERDQVNWWLASRTPLLKDTRPRGAVVLSGPAGSVTAVPEPAAILSMDDEHPTLGELTLDDLILLGRI